MKLTTFSGFPYIISRVMTCLYDISLLPKTLTLEEAKKITKAHSVGGQSCLVIGAKECYYYEKGESIGKRSKTPPVGGNIYSGIRPAPVAMDEEMLDRVELLTKFSSGKHNFNMVGIVDEIHFVGAKGTRTIRLMPED